MSFEAPLWTGRKAIRLCLIACAVIGIVLVKEKHAVGWHAPYEVEITTLLSLGEPVEDFRGKLGVKRWRDRDCRTTSMLNKKNGDIRNDSRLRLDKSNPCHAGLLGTILLVSH